jgi:hypothetical protein
MTILDFQWAFLAELPRMGKTIIFLTPNPQLAESVCNAPTCSAAADNKGHRHAPPLDQAAGPPLAAARSGHRRRRPMISSCQLGSGAAHARTASIIKSDVY